MTNGILIFAHNSRQVDYALMAIISGGLAKKNLKVPVSLVTDQYTLEWMQISNIHSQALKIFDKIIEVKKPVTLNQRIMADAYTSTMVPFVNTNRASVWQITPYERTLLIDSDFLIMSNTLSNYWDVESSVMISSSMVDVRGDRIGILDKSISETSAPLFWATTVMFTKNNESKLFFNLVEHIRDNYVHYADLFRFDPTIYRNDISFSVAKHILNSFEYDGKNFLPPILTSPGKDLIYDVEENKIKLLLNDDISEDNVIATVVENRDIHIMNKQSIIRNAEKFMSLI